MVPVNIRIIGVCLATPLSYREKPVIVERITVLTPSSPRCRIASDGQTQIDALYTYLVVKMDNVNSASTRKPDLLLNRETVGVFMFHREEITIEDDEPGAGVLLPYGDAEFPIQPTDTSRDPRWIAHLSSFVAGSKVKPDCYTDAPPPELCTRLVVRSGEFSGQFPCVDKVKKRKMKHTSFEGFLAQEMVATLPAPNGFLSLRCKPFATNQQANRIILQSIAQNGYDAFFVAGPLVNALALGDEFDPCAMTHDRHNGHTDADYEFEALWDLFTLPDGALKPVPDIAPQHGPRADCIPGSAG